MSHPRCLRTTTDEQPAHASVSRRFLALTGLLYVAAETLPTLEYLTSCDKLIVVATLIV